MGAKERRLGRGWGLHNSDGAVWEMLSYHFMREKINAYRNKFYNSVGLKENESAMRVLLFQQRTL